MKFHYHGNELERSEVLLTYTPLLFAIEKEDPSMVLLLLGLGADPLVTGWTRYILRVCKSTLNIETNIETLKKSVLTLSSFLMF